jgi:hypothetical protein
LAHTLGRHRYAVDVISLVTDNKRSRLAGLGRYGMHRHHTFLLASWTQDRRTGLAFTSNLCDFNARTADSGHRLSSSSLTSAAPLPAPVRSSNSSRAFSGVMPMSDTPPNCNNHIN